MTGRELKKKYVEFFRGRGHAVISGKSLIPENDPTVLFTTAGMHPLVPYILGEPHPAGKRLVDVQKCIRTGDIEEVGDATHLTFFEMLGNWSLGDYFKDEAIRLSYEFLTSREWLGFDPQRLSVTVFAGDAEVPPDEEAAAVWRSLGIPEERIHFLGREDNWWGPAGQTGPCGPDTEMFIDTGSPPCGSGLPAGLQLRQVLRDLERRLHAVQQDRRGGPTCPWPRRPWTRAWGWSAPSPCCRAATACSRPSCSGPSRAACRPPPGAAYGAGPPRPTAPSASSPTTSARRCSSWATKRA